MKKALLLSLLLLLIFISCSKSLSGTSWVLERVDGSYNKTTETIVFADKTFKMNIVEEWEKQNRINQFNISGTYKMNQNILIFDDGSGLFEAEIKDEQIIFVSGYSGIFRKK